MTMTGPRVRRCQLRGSRSCPGASQYRGVRLHGLHGTESASIGDRAAGSGRDGLGVGQLRGGKYLISASWTTVVASTPSRVKKRPVPSPRDPAATGDSRGVEHPVVEAELAVEPHRMVHGGGEQPVDTPRQSVGGDDRVQHRGVGGVTHRRDVEQRIVGHLAVGPHPHPVVLEAFAGFAGLPGRDRWRSGCRSDASRSRTSRPGPRSP